jgi:DNA-binding transcriptional MerR regulator
VTDSEPRWTITELNEHVEAALSEGYEAPRNGQVRAVPNTRAIRYYTTLGLLDRPADMRGRTALYTSRHLMQIVAIKRLQAGGKTLADIQSALGGIDDAALAEIARIPRVSAAPRRRSRSRGRDARFWAAAPSDGDVKIDGAATSVSEDAPITPGLEPTVRVHLPLAAGVTLVVDPARTLTEDDGRALREAAAALVRHLETSGLVRSR